MRFGRQGVNSGLLILRLEELEAAESDVSYNFTFVKLRCEMTIP